LHRVSLPSQAVGSVIKLNVVRFSLGKVLVKQAGAFDEANQLASVPELQAGATPNFKVIARQLVIANESPAKQTTVSLRESAETDKIDAEIKVVAEKPWTASLNVTNGGTETTGRDRLTASIQHANLFNRDHVGTLAYTTTSRKPSNVQQWGATYRLPLYTLGGVLSGTYTRSNVVGNFGGFDVSGAGETFGVMYTHHFDPKGDSRSSVNVGYDIKSYDPARFNGIPLTLLGAQQQTRPISVGYTYRNEVAGIAYGLNGELIWNTSGGTGNDLTSYRDSDPRVRTTRFSVARGGASVAYQTAGQWAFTGRMQAQTSRNALIPGEQFGLGGPSSVRGMPDRVISADSGVFVSLEALTPNLLPNFRLAGFIDSGWLSNQIESVPTKPSSDSATTVGLGLRWSYDRYVSLSLDWARVISGSKVPTAIGAQNGDSKTHLNVSFRY
jgi:hemolysin activation/secretion protein